MEMWRIFVPVLMNGNEVPVSLHKFWDSIVRDITKGLTIYKPAKGQWVSPTGILFSEPMIPVEIACTREQILQIARMTKSFYNQEAVLAYKISEEVLIV